MRRYRVEATFEIEVEAEDKLEAEEIATEKPMVQWELWSGPTAELLEPVTPPEVGGTP